MATATHHSISVSEYLHTSYRPDCDYVDGMVEERNLVFSPDAGVPRYSERLEDYRKMGVKHIWVVDPAKRKGFDCSVPAWIETAEFSIPGTSIQIGLGAIFAAIDEDQSR